LMRHCQHSNCDICANHERAHCLCKKTLIMFPDHLQ